MDYIKDSIGKLKYKSLAYIKRLKLEAYGYLVGALLCLQFLVGCQSHSTDTEYEDSNFEKRDNVVLADADIEFGKYKSYSIRLVMTEGEYYTQEQTVPGGGTYKENYDGEYILQFRDANEEIVDEISLNKDWIIDRINFPGEFILCAGDYNKDELPDFTIGTYGSSSMNIFKIYSVDSDGKITNIGEFADISKEFSIYLEQEEESSNFYATTWNNAIGEEEKIKYIWSFEEGRYIEE